MPFHVGGHKPKAPKKAVRFSIGGRLVVGGIGAFMIGDGLYRLNLGQFDGVDFYNLPVYTTSFVATGIVGILIALIPVSWLEAVARRLPK